MYNFFCCEDLTKSEFMMQWNKLKQPGTYEVQMGDYVLPAIAHCTEKDILIFHSDHNYNHDPISVVEANIIGGRSANTRVPVLLAYNGIHYEGLAPNSHQDLLRTIALKESYLDGTYISKSTHKNEIGGRNMTLPLKDSKNDKWLVSEEQKRTQKGKISSMKFSSHTDSDKHCMDKKKISKKRRRNTLSEEQNKQDLLRTIDLKESYLNDTYESKKKDEHQDSLKINSQKRMTGLLLSVT